MIIRMKELNWKKRNQFQIKTKKNLLKELNMIIRTKLRINNQYFMKMRRKRVYIRNKLQIKETGNSNFFI